MSVLIRPAIDDPATAQAVGDNMREEDAREVKALHQYTPHQSVLWSLRMAQESYAATYDGEAAAVFGVHSTGLGRVGVPWLLGTKVIERHPAAFLRLSRRYVAHLRAGHTRLENRVHVDNSHSIKYLRLLGFEFEEPEFDTHGVGAMRFSMKGDLDV